MRYSLAWLAAGLFSASFAAFGGPIYTDSFGREWLDLNDTRNRSWVDTAQVCDTGSGSCSGVLATTTPFSLDIDLTGYTWATRDDVRNLWLDVAGLPSGSLDNYSATFPTTSGHGASLFAHFEPTIQFNNGPGFDNVLNGLTRDLFMGPEQVLQAYSGVVFNSAAGTDFFSLTGGLPADVREISQGVYLYREVPEPGSLALMGLGLIALWIARRRKQAMQSF